MADVILAHLRQKLPASFFSLNLFGLRFGNTRTAQNWDFGPHVITAGNSINSAAQRDRSNKLENAKNGRTLTPQSFFCASEFGGLVEDSITFARVRARFPTLFLGFFSGSNTFVLIFTCTSWF